MKDYVCIVSRNISDSSKEFLTEYEDYIRSKGYSSYANKIEGYLSGNFGSGFTYYGPDGKPYIVTNRHVVSNAETADVKFELDNGEYEEYKNLTIVAVDDTLDIAVIALPAGFKRGGLGFRVSALSEGDDVWSAGFPALGNNPMWQFGKGTVTNPKARIKELIDPNVTTIVQHSAEIDSGNSGGPLLVKNSNYAAGYAVAGINTWKAFYRQNTNFAIPSSAVKTCVDTLILKKNAAGDISSRLTAFSKAVKNESEKYRGIAKFISNDMISISTGDSFLEVLKKAPSEVRSEIVYTFIEDPLEGLKYSIAYSIWNKFYDDEEIKDYQILTPEKVEKGTKVTVRIEEETVDSLWINSQGAWRLVEFGELKMESKDGNKSDLKSKKKDSSKKKKDTSLEINNPYCFQLAGGVALPLNDRNPGFDISFMWFPGDYVGAGFFVHNEQAKVKDFFSNEINVDPAFSFGPQVSVRVPLNFNYIIVEPKAGAKLGFMSSKRSKSGSNLNYNSSSDVNSGLICALSGGLDLTFAISENFAITLGGEYLHTFYPDDSIGNINITGGVRFLGK